VYFSVTFVFQVRWTERRRRRRRKHEREQVVSAAASQIEEEGERGRIETDAAGTVDKYDDQRGIFLK
jgi:hypothetical protein